MSKPAWPNALKVFPWAGTAVQDVANLIAFLASEGSGYITGQSIFVDGGGVPPT